MYKGFKTARAWLLAPITPEPGSSFEVLAVKSPSQADPLKNDLYLAAKWRGRDGGLLTAAAMSDATLEDCVALLLERVKQIERGEISGRLD